MNLEKRIRGCEISAKLFKLLALGSTVACFYLFQNGAQVSAMIAALTAYLPFRYSKEKSIESQKLVHEIEEQIARPGTTKLEQTKMKNYIIVGYMTKDSICLGTKPEWKTKYARVKNKHHFCLIDPESNTPYIVSFEDSNYALAIIHPYMTNVVSYKGNVNDREILDNVLNENGLDKSLLKKNFIKIAEVKDSRDFRKTLEEYLK